MKKILRVITSEKNYHIVVPILSIIAAFLVGSVVLMVSGLSPVEAFKGIIKGVSGIDLSKIGGKKFFNARVLGEFGVAVMPIALTGLSVAFAARTGLFNIGAEGQLLVGSLFSVSAALLLDLPKIIHLPIAVIAGAIGGALWGSIPGILKAKFRVNEVVVCIMLNYAGLYLSNLLLKHIPGYFDTKTPIVPDSASLKSDFLAEITGKSRFHWGFIVVIIAVIIFHYIIEKTSFGYELRAVGHNKNAAKYAGMKVSRNTILSMTISGAFAGLGGTMLVLGTFGFGRVLTVSEGYGFTGIAVSLVGANTGIGSLIGALIFGGISNSGRTLQVNKIPFQITMILSALIILFIAMKFGMQIGLKKLDKYSKGDK